MKTEIRTFCDAFAEELRPYIAELEKGLEAMPQDEAEPLAQGWRKRLRESRHRAEALCDKIAQQHAYLLLFGPLKSGKSTLMNAVASSYVSEVSSLPAYPALVYAQHGEKQNFQATTYAGDKLDFANSQAMADAVSKSHEELAEKILEVERKGESFEPHVHFPDAIRRMDVQTPAKALAESGSVLVDTPGLYTRMRFGYDVMTKDFRDNASCAIFVVKSDNLFYEKVFEEFNDLLGYFSRIFLVVNIDSSKQDLNPDGSLQPSLESRDPAAIIRAFQSLAMSAPLREAYEKGSLNVYPIDLLKAASSRLKQAAGLETDDEEGPGEGFKQFVGDLTSYLNSSDYLREFMSDSLRVGTSLQSEISSVVSEDVAETLKSDRESWTQKLEATRAKQRALVDLSEVDWGLAFADVRTEKDRLLEDYSSKDRSGLGDALSAGLEKWLDSDDTLRSLRDDYLNVHIKRETTSEAEEILERLRDRMNTRNGGARFGAEEELALETTGLKPESIVQELLHDLSSEHNPEPPRLELTPEDIPLKRTFADIILFRSKKASRERFFGEEGKEFVASSKKRKRISGKHLEALREMVKEYPSKDLPQTQREYVDGVLESYITRFGEALDRQREELASQLESEKAESEEALKANAKMQSVFDRMEKANGNFAMAVEKLKQDFGTELESEIAEADSDETPALEVERIEDVDESLQNGAAPSRDAAL